jgi:F-type H+-transporting ATPase subunit epsilon
MAEEIIHFEIVTPFRQVYSGEVTSIRVPGVEGYLGVLPRHTPYMVALTTGEITIGEEGVTKYFATTGGFAEVLPNRVTVLAESAEEASEIDIQRAEEARARAEKRLAEGRKHWDVERARAALLRAKNRLNVARRI